MLRGERAASASALGRPRWLRPRYSWHLREFLDGSVPECTGGDGIQENQEQWDRRANNGGLVRPCEPGGSKTWISTAYLDPTASGTAENARGRAWIRVRLRRRDDTSVGVIVHERREEEGAPLSGSRARSAIGRGQICLRKFGSCERRVWSDVVASIAVAIVQATKLFVASQLLLLDRLVGRSMGHSSAQILSSSKSSHFRFCSGLASHYFPCLNHYFTFSARPNATIL